MRFPAFGLGNSPRHNRALRLAPQCGTPLFTNRRRVPRGKICIDLYKKGCACPKDIAAPHQGAVLRAPREAGEKEKDRAEPSLLWAEETRTREPQATELRSALATVPNYITTTARAGPAIGGRARITRCISPMRGTRTRPDAP
jgi:hypothetical protein